AANTMTKVNFTKIEFINQTSSRKWARSGNDLARTLKYSYALDTGSFGLGDKVRIIEADNHTG
ncbi:MAG: hypothetical protein WCD80_04340, partial [Desulfobaccales bacterium]